MIETGSALCLQCGEVLSDLYYFNQGSQSWIVLRKLSEHKYKVEKFTPKRAKPSSSFDFKLSDKCRNLISDGIPEIIYVDYKEKGVSGAVNEELEQPFVRSCPFCYRSSGADGNTNRTIFSDFGRLRTYVVALIGTRAVGKSSWIKALSNVSNLNALRKYPYCLDTTILEMDVVKGRSTGVGEDGSTRMLTISKRATKTERKKPLINVLLLDFAGELFMGSDSVSSKTDADEEAKRKEKERANMLLKGSGKYTGADAVVFMDTADNKEGPISTYNCVKSLGILENRPVALVFNKVDLLFDEPPKVYLSNKPMKVPLLTEVTFDYERNSDVNTRDADMYSKEKLVPRVCLETALAVKHCPLASLIIEDNPRSAGFFIQTAKGNLIDNPNGQPMESVANLACSLNVMDPIIWLLNELDILPVV